VKVPNKGAPRYPADPACQCSVAAGGSVPEPDPPPVELVQPRSPQAAAAVVGKKMEPRKYASSKRNRLQSFTFDVYWCVILMGDLSRDSWISFVQTLKKVSSWRPHDGTRKTEMRAGRHLRRGSRTKSSPAGSRGHGRQRGRLKSGRRCPTRDGGIRGRESSTAAFRAAAI
jgi:hypothetical protein